MATTQQQFYSNLCILIKTKHSTIIEKKQLSETDCFNGAMGDVLVSSEWCSVEM